MRRRILVNLGPQRRIPAATGEAVEDVVLYFIPETEPDLGICTQDDSEQCHLVLSSAD